MVRVNVPDAKPVTEQTPLVVVVEPDPSHRTPGGNPVTEATDSTAPVRRSRTRTSSDAVEGCIANTTDVGESAVIATVAKVSLYPAFDAFTTREPAGKGDGGAHSPLTSVNAEHRDEPSERVTVTSWRAVPVRASIVVTVKVLVGEDTNVMSIDVVVPAVGRTDTNVVL